MDISWILFLISLQFTVQCLCYSLSLSRNEESDNRLDLDDEKDRDSRDSRERSDWRRPDTYQDDQEKAQFKGWNYIDTSKEWSPHKKTISLQVLDDPPYYGHGHGGRPSWPHDEYLYGNFYGSHNRNGSGNSSTRPSDLASSPYEWQRLPYRYSYYPYPYPNQQSVTETNTNTKLETTDAQGTTSISDKRHHPYVYGNSWYNPYYGNEFRGGGGGGRRRFRLQIHPGLIAAPLAGIAAYKAASAFNPLLVELGIIDKGHGHDHGHGWGGSGYPQYPSYPAYPPPISPIVPSYPPPYRPPIGPPIGGAYPPNGIHDSQTPYPILIPGRQTENEKSSWWNPFSVLTPRS